MNRSTALFTYNRLRAFFGILVSTAICSGLTGCNYFILLGYLIGGPPSIEPDFNAATGRSMAEKEVTVAVVVYAPEDIQFDHSGIDFEINKYVSNRLHQHQISTISPIYIKKWMDENPDWDIASEIGAQFETDFVIYIDIHEFSLYEKNSHNLYRGRTEAMISVFEMFEDGEGEKIYSKELTSKYPLEVARDVSEETYNTFKQKYLSRVSEEIGRHFYEHYNGDDIPDAN